MPARSRLWPASQRAARADARGALAHDAKPSDSGATTLGQTRTAGYRTSSCHQSEVAYYTAILMRDRSPNPLMAMTA